MGWEVGYQITTQGVASLVLAAYASGVRRAAAGFLGLAITA
jgi:hypothetical protein